MAGVRETLCRRLDVDVVGKLLVKKEAVSKAFKSNIRTARKSKDVEVFFDVIKKFDLKTFVAFLEVLQCESLSNENHRVLYSLICSDLKRLSINLDPENEEYITKLNAMAESDSEIRPKMEDECPEGTTDVSSSSVDTISGRIRIRLRPHLSESEIFSREQEENVFYSQTHGVTVIADHKAMPEHSLEVILTVNDYFRPVIVPTGYNASYSPLISLKSDPEFLDSVSVTIPHCAIGDIEESLCILSAPEDLTCREIHLEEDRDVEIDTIDEHYFTFRTKHFTWYKLGVSHSHSSMHVRTKCTGKDRKAAHSSVTTGRQRDRRCNARFVAVKYVRAQSSSHWKYVFFVTYATSTFIEVCVML